MSNPIITVDTDGPVFLLDLETDTMLDNKYFRFCSDDPMADEATYEDFDIHPCEILPKGTIVKITYLWGWDKSNHGLTQPTDYQVELPKNAPLMRAVYVILSRYHYELSSNNADGRFYFVEQATRKDGVIEIGLGT